MNIGTKVRKPYSLEYGIVKEVEQDHVWVQWNSSRNILSRWRKARVKKAKIL